MPEKILDPRMEEALDKCFMYLAIYGGYVLNTETLEITLPETLEEDYGITEGDMDAL